MKVEKKRALIPLQILLSVFIHLSTQAQSDTSFLHKRKEFLREFANEKLNEKIHLHMDKQVYSLGDTCWFKAYTILSNDPLLSELSGVLYVDLINTRDSIIQKIKLSLTSGLGEGDFILGKDYEPGIYRIRAYTQFMLNQKEFIKEIPFFVNTSFESETRAYPNTYGNNKTVKNIEFYPEGGTLLEEVKLKIAFKAKDSVGKPVKINGLIQDSTGKTIVSFQSEKNGTGYFYLNPGKGMTYYALVNNSNGKPSRFALPRIHQDGISLSINQRNDSLFVRIATNDYFLKTHLNLPFHLLGESRGNVHYYANGKLDFPVFFVKIPTSLFPSGIAHFTLFSDEGFCLANRSVPIFSNDSLPIEVKSKLIDSNSHNKIHFSFYSKNSSGENSQKNFSISISLVPEIKDVPSAKDIRSDILFRSESSSPRNNPWENEIPYSKSNLDYLDLALLTENFRTMEGSENRKQKKWGIPVQKDLSLSGYIRTPSGKISSNNRVQLTALKERMAMDTLSNEKGEFEFNHINLQDSVSLLISAKKENESQNLKIYIREPETLPVQPLLPLEGDQDKTGPIALQNRKRILNPGKPSLRNAKTIQLKQVLVKDKKDNLHDTQYLENLPETSHFHGSLIPDRVVLADKFAHCPNFIDCIRTNIPEVSFRINKNGFQVPVSTRKYPPIPLDVFINEARVDPEEINFIEPGIVSSVILNLSSQAMAYFYGIKGGSLMISYKTGAIEQALKTDKKGIISYPFIGYHTPKTFALKSNIEQNSPGYLGKTIYWNPNIWMEGNAKWEMDLPELKTKAFYKITIEGLNEKGNLGSKLIYLNANPQ